MSPEKCRPGPYFSPKSAETLRTSRLLGQLAGRQGSLPLDFCIERQDKELWLKY